MEEFYLAKGTVSRFEHRNKGSFWRNHRISANQYPLFSSSRITGTLAKN
jgi:hypothetical protein